MQLSTNNVVFPVKLTDPVTAVLYITSDYQHMQELKHTIHVKEVVDGKIFEIFNVLSLVEPQYVCIFAFVQKHNNGLVKDSN